MYKSYRRTSSVGSIGASPGLETLAIIVMAPVLMLVDVVLTWVRLFKEYNDQRDNEKKIL